MAKDLLKSIIMKKSILFFNILVFVLCLNTQGQKPVIELTFTGVNNETWVSMESIEIKNITRGVDTMLFYPDTILVLHYQVGINELNQQSNGLIVFQNYPNPVKEHTTITMYVPDKDNVNIMIKDAMGRQVISKEQVLDKGYHSFRFNPGADHLYFFMAKWKETCSSIKIINGGTNPGRISSLEHIGNNKIITSLKSLNDIQVFSFDTGDDLIFVGKTNGMESGIFDEPKTNTSYTFQFATNIPCPGTPTVTYEGQTYNTLQIFSQCWLKENLNVGIMIDSLTDMSDNGVIEKYCYRNMEDSCDIYGGLYQWNELMQYSMSPGSQGICPPGWHIPTDDDWIILGGSVDSQYSIGDPEWYNSGYNGFDVGLNLKSENGWSSNGNGSDSFGFLALPGGQRISNGYFDGISIKASFWSSTEDYPEASWYRALSSIYDGIDRSSQTNNWGKSVRCIQD